MNRIIFPLLFVIILLAGISHPPLLEKPPEMAPTCPSCSGEKGDPMENREDLPCISDKDCVEGECCHARTCLNRIVAPDCSDVACTLNCEPNTLDCGQGTCRCIGGKCTAVFN